MPSLYLKTDIQGWRFAFIKSIIAIDYFGSVRKVGYVPFESFPKTIWNTDISASANELILKGQ